MLNDFWDNIKIGQIGTGAPLSDRELCERRISRGRPFQKGGQCRGWKVFVKLNYFQNSKYFQSHLLLIRDEAGHPDVSLCSWADGVLLVFSLADEESFRLVTEYSRRFSHSRPNLPLFLIGTQDALGARSPRVIDDSRAR